MDGFRCSKSTGRRAEPMRGLDLIGSTNQSSGLKEGLNPQTDTLKQPSTRSYLGLIWSHWPGSSWQHVNISKVMVVGTFQSTIVNSKPCDVTGMKKFFKSCQISNEFTQEIQFYTCFIFKMITSWGHGCAPTCESCSVELEH